MVRLARRNRVTAGRPLEQEAMRNYE